MEEEKVSDLSSFLRTAKSWTKCSLELSELDAPKKLNALDLLYKLCKKNNFKPKFKHLTSNGPQHCLSIVMEVQVGHLRAEGSGRNMPKAKLAAAEAVLQKMKAEASPEIVEQTIKYESSNITNEYPTNAIGELQNLCQALLLSAPKFKFISCKGRPHECRTAMSCSLHGMKTYGVGLTKQLAKHKAAAKMIKILEKTKGEEGDIEIIQGKLGIIGRDIPTISKSDFGELRSRLETATMPAELTENIDTLEPVSDVKIQKTVERFFQEFGKFQYHLKQIVIFFEREKGIIRHVEEIKILPSKKYFCGLTCPERSLTFTGIADTAEKASQKAYYCAFLYLKHIFSKRDRGESIEACI